MRLPPLPADEWDEAVRRALGGIMPAERQNPDNAGNAIATFVRHPELARVYLRYNFYLMDRSTLPDRLRELAILRVAHRRGCEYEWWHHVVLARRAGLSDDDIEAIQRGEPADEFERTVVHAVDELEEKSNMSDATWATLATRFDERQLMDLTFTVGCYGALAMAFNTFGVELEPDFAVQGKQER
jgi:4-carboxymuconolactone decarboxylase